MALKFTNDERFNLARGLVRDATSVHKFGAVPAMSVAATGTIWDINDTLYPWSAWATPGVVTALTYAAALFLLKEEDNKEYSDKELLDIVFENIEHLKQNTQLMEEIVNVTGPAVPGTGGDVAHWKAPKELSKKKKLDILRRSLK